MSEQQTGPGWTGADGTWYSATMPQSPPDDAWRAPAERLVAAPSPVKPPEFTIKPYRRWSGLATTSMVLGVLWLLWVGSVLAIVFGHIALHQTAEDTSLGGRSMAIVGATLGWVGVGTFALFAVLRWA